MPSGSGLRLAGGTCPWVRSGRFESHAGSVVVKEFDTRLLQRRLHPHQRAGVRLYRSVEGFHTPDGADSDLSRLREFGLAPAQERPRGA